MTQHSFALHRVLWASLRRSIAYAISGLALLNSLVACGWALIHLCCGDRWWWLFLLNSGAVYLFAPIPLLLGWALLARRRTLSLLLGGVLCLGAIFYGSAFLPKPVPPDTGTPAVTFMTANLLGFNLQSRETVAAIRASNADVIGLQELSPWMADAIQRDLAVDYPYQVLDPEPSVMGMGVISRLPLQATGEQLPGSWVGAPQVLHLTVQAQMVTLVHFHAISPYSSSPAIIEWTTAERERQARTLASFAGSRSTPVVLLGDFNATDQSDAYRLLAAHFNDAWRSAGWGLGQTYPGTDLSGNTAPEFHGIPFPRWLVRIDYIFYSGEWQALSTRLGPWNGSSDHRPVVARLMLRGISGTSR